jgi:hypothetical protein
VYHKSKSFGQVSQGLQVMFIVRDGDIFLRGRNC